MISASQTALSVLRKHSTRKVQESHRMEIFVSDKSFYIFIVIQSLLLAAFLFIFEASVKMIQLFINNRRQKERQELIKQLKEIRNKTMEYCFNRFVNRYNEAPRVSPRPDLNEQRFMEMRPAYVFEISPMRSRILQRRRQRQEATAQHRNLTRIDSGIDMRVLI